MTENIQNMTEPKHDPKKDKYDKKCTIYSRDRSKRSKRVPLFASSFLIASCRNEFRGLKFCKYVLNIIDNHHPKNDSIRTLSRKTYQ